MLTGGMPSLALGLVNSRLVRFLLTAAFPTTVNGYRRMTRRWLGEVIPRGVEITGPPH